MSIYCIFDGVFIIGEKGTLGGECRRWRFMFYVSRVKILGVGRESRVSSRYFLKFFLEMLCKFMSTFVFMGCEFFLLI